MKKATECIYCRSRISRHWDSVDVWKCSSCGLLFRNPFPSETELANLYEAGWCDPEKNRSETGSTDLALARTYARKIAAELNQTDFRRLTLLEFGAGKGAMMAAMEELGAEVYGVEPFGYEYLEKKGFKIFRTLDEVPKGFVFDGIIAIQVIEHLIEPWNMMEKFRELLKESGWLYVSTLNANGLNARVSRSRWREVRKKGHLIFFTSRNLENILFKIGFRRYKRLRWFVKYRNDPFRKLTNFLLQLCLLDGELRYLAWRPN
jgi:2-polyprenyl-3-methyl-5-hydroxy-6-metoxy-1,4-benzoquinol methylase